MNDKTVSRKKTESTRPPRAIYIAEPEKAGDPGFNGNWYALRTRSRCEFKVFGQLKDKHIPSFLPTIRTWSIRRDRRKLLDVPMFSGYLFVRCGGDSKSVLPVLKTPGAVDLLRLEGAPQPIPVEQIDSLRRILEADEHVEAHPYIEKGDRVVVKWGPMRGAVGVFLGINEKRGKLVVSVEILKRSVMVEVDAGLLTKF